MKPFFSIIVPTYNQSNLLKNCLSSIYSQTFKNFETIIIDNYSKDNTREIVKNFRQNKNLKYVKFKNNGVIAKSRNLGIKLSKGKWVCFLDSDDTWTMDKLQTIFNLQKKKKSVELICNAEWIINGIKKKYRFYGPENNKFYVRMLEKGNLMSTSAVCIKKNFLFKKNLLFNVNKIFNTCEDYDFFLNISKINCKKIFFNKPLGFHLLHSKSASSNKNKFRKAFINVIKYHLKINYKYIQKKINFNDLVFRYDFKVLCSNIMNLINVRKNLKEFIKFIQKRPLLSVMLIIEFLIIKLKNKFYYFLYLGPLAQK